MSTVSGKGKQALDESGNDVHDPVYEQDDVASATGNQIENLTSIQHMANKGEPFTAPCLTSLASAMFLAGLVSLK
ncbi:Hypothetical predicted protein [Pelobates cultripes]|uniref:Uncharacterized protein n=1 Tax=Pelobates cultripes TaxID=61616 RepID=A0AAD1T5C1_PELCU|nr:Hypothetical predicted protein [Pelobates cultripes]